MSSLASNANKLFRLNKLNTRVSNTSDSNNNNNEYVTDVVPKHYAVENQVIGHLGHDGKMHYKETTIENNNGHIVNHRHKHWTTAALFGGYNRRFCRCSCNNNNNNRKHNKTNKHTHKYKHKRRYATTQTRRRYTRR
jgi:hypothetical protein